MPTVIRNPSGVNIRQRPAGPIIRLLADGTPVTALATGTVDALLLGAKYTWQAIRVTADDTVGWVVASFVSDSTTPPTGNRLLSGVHALQDAGNVIDALLTATPGITLPSATVVDEPKNASKLLGRTKYIVVRASNLENNNAFPDDPTAAARLATDYVGHNIAWILSQPSGVYIQPVNEVKIQGVVNAAAHNAYWLAYMQALETHGRKAAICAYAVGQPEVNEWQQLVPALQWAQAHGHVVVLHAYCAPGTPVGQLSADGADYEFRFAKLYDSVPPTARPDLVISEFSHEFTRGLYEGPDALVKTTTLYHKAVQQYPYFQGFNLYTIGTLGGWDTSSIDSAVQQIADGMRRGWL